MADNTGTRASQIKSIDRHGNGAKLQASDGTGVSGNLPKFNADGSLTDSGVAAGGGVTSVALSMPSEFSVSGSPITGVGTLTVTKANENANLVFAGPASGAAAQPTFRALVAADLPAGTTAAPVRETPSGTLNGSNRTFTLSFTPNPSASLLLFLNGVEQDQSTWYTISASTITYTIAPESGDQHVAQYTH
jgi:hypothetical protein